MVRRRSPAHGATTINVPSTERREFLPFAPPALGQDEIDEVIDTLRSPWITTGPKVQRFEKEFRAYLNAPGALALNSCTAALHTALICLGIGPGDEVVTTPMTFAATVNVIEHTGARPVLADVSPTTLNIDPGAIARALTPRTRAIIPVHFAGHPAQMDEIDALAAQNRLHVIEDAAHALPAGYRGHRIGARRNPTAFSFYATKNLTTGEGGMLTGDVEFLERARIVSLHGMSRDAWKRYGSNAQWFYEITEPGYKYNMTDIQAAIGVVQLAKLGHLHERRCQIAAMYTAAFADEDALELPVSEPGIDHAWHLYVIRLRRDALHINRNRFIDELTRRRIGTSVHFIPIHLHPYYRNRYGYEPTSFPIAYDSYERMLSIPLNPRMSDQDALDVIENVLDVIDEFRR